MCDTTSMKMIKYEIKNLMEREQEFLRSAQILNYARERGIITDLKEYNHKVEKLQKDFTKNKKKLEEMRNRWIEERNVKARARAAMQIAKQAFQTSENQKLTKTQAKRLKMQEEEIKKEKKAKIRYMNCRLMHSTKELNKAQFALQQEENQATAAWFSNDKNKIEAKMMAVHAANALWKLY